MDELIPYRPDVCPECEGKGWVLEDIDEERFPVRAYCQRCKLYCTVCRQWVKRKNHSH
jgi:uncharacterized protein YbaR (Trm112 family)